MPSYVTQKTLPYTQEHLYQLVADIERYPEFLPWCEGARILERKGNVVIADLLIGFEAINGKYTSHVTLDPAQYVITVDLAEGPFHHLRQQWKFIALAEQQTQVCFDIDFKMKIAFLEKVVDKMFDSALEKMMVAFEQRAAVI